MKALAEIAAICVLGTLAFAAASHATAAKVTDPRRCATNTPGGTAHHAYWCAKYAAVATVRTVMARRQHVPEWFAPTFCDQGTTLLRWRCSTFLGGDKWAVTVTWRATSTGWHRYAAVVQSKR